MHADILATGDEIRTGALVDTNSAHIADALEMNSITVVRHLCVGDDIGALADAIRDIAARRDVAVVTGGLGPTSDDLSAAAAAVAAGVSLKTDAVALKTMAAFFASRGRQMGASNRKQADLPDGALCLPNPVGTAPGFAVTIGRCRFFFLPGVPGEMRRMMADQVMPRIREMNAGDGTVNALRVAGAFGLTEASVNRRLEGFADVFGDVKLGFRARFPVIEVKLYGSGDDAARADRRLQEAMDWVRSRLGDHVFSDRGETMAAVVGRLILARNQTVVTAESCTGGLVSHWLTDVPGSSRYFLGAAVTYANAVKEQLIGVPHDTIVAHGAVSEATAAAMAVGVARACGADLAVATSGIAGPDGGTSDKPVGTVCIGVHADGETTAFRRHFPIPDRDKNKALFAMTAIDALRRMLLGLPLG